MSSAVTELLYLVAILAIAIVLRFLLPKLLQKIGDKKTNAIVALGMDVITAVIRSEEESTEAIKQDGFTLMPYLEVILNPDNVGKLYDADDLYRRAASIIGRMLARSAKLAKNQQLVDLLLKLDSTDTINQLVVSVLKQVSVINPRFGSLLVSMHSLYDLLCAEKAKSLEIGGPEDESTAE